MPMAQENNSTSQQKYLFPSIAGLVLILIILFIAYKLPCPSNSQYVIFRIVLSIGISGFAAVISGFFNFNYKGIITAGGALAIFAFVYYYTPTLINTNDKCNEPIDYSVFLQDSTGRVPIHTNSFLVLRVNNALNKQIIDDDGRSIFDQIPFNLKDSTLTLQLIMEGWQFSNNKKITTFNLVNKSSTLIIKRDNSLCCISGTVRDENHFLEGVKLRIGNESSQTNDNGWFSISIPSDKQKEEYRLIAEKEGYQIWEATVYPSTGQEIGILLKKL